MRLVSSGAAVVAAAFLASLGGCGGGGGGDPRSCGGGGACGETARCLGSTCVEDVAPVAVLGVPRDLEALALVEFDGSASSDPDASIGDEIKAFHWSFTSLDGACPAPASTGTEAKARVRFGCAGAFRVTLVVADDLGKESAPASADLTVAPYAGNPMLIASADQSVDHLCAGTPRVCTTQGATPVVRAHLADGVQPVGAVAYQWTVETSLDSHKRVAFAPSAGVADPSVRIEVDEVELQAIKNDWIFRVSASDDAGPLGEAATRISVKNRPPVLAAAQPSAAVDHAYSAGFYRASADASVWSDPDGDPLSLAGATGSTSCASVSFKANGTAVIDCARAFSGTPGLAGFAATHSVSVRARDPWDAAASASTTSVTIQNHPPTATSSTVNVAAPSGTCSAGVCCRSDPEPPRECIAWRISCDAYVAHPKPIVTDPDGDPLVLDWAWTGGSTGSAVCEPSACAADLAVPAATGCETPPGGTASGSFTVSDGLNTGSATLTVNY